MRFYELNEASFDNFADQAVQAVDKLTGAAGAAFGKFKSAHDKAKSSIEGDITKAQSLADKEAEKAKTAAEKIADKKNADAKKKLGGQIPQLVAKVALDRTPQDPDDIEEFHKLGAEQFVEAEAAIDKAQERLNKFPREMRKALKSGDFLDAQQRTDQQLNLVLGIQPEKGVEAAEDMLMKNLYDEQSVWTQVMTSDDVAGSAENMVELLTAIAGDFARRNLAATGSGKAKAYPETVGVVKLMSTQRQLIGIRLGLLRGALEQLAEKPVTEAAQRRVRKLLERMNWKQNA